MGLVVDIVGICVKDNVNFFYENRVFVWFEKVIFKNFEWMEN